MRELEHTNSQQSPELVYVEWNYSHMPDVVSHNDWSNFGAKVDLSKETDHCTETESIVPRRYCEVFEHLAGVKPVG